MYRYLTAEKIFSGKTLPDDVETVIMCFCPLPTSLAKYKISDIHERLFLLLAPILSMICEFDGKKFLVLHEIYGGPVTTALVEELHYYGIKKIIGLGYVGSMLPELKIGTNIKINKSLIELGTTPHYLSKSFTGQMISLSNLELGALIELPDHLVWTTNAIYQEYEADVQRALKLGASCVNIDTSHFIAACNYLQLSSCYVATVSDHLQKDEWINDLSGAVNNNEDNIVINGQKELIKTILKLI